MERKNLFIRSLSVVLAVLTIVFAVQIGAYADFFNSLNQEESDTQEENENYTRVGDEVFEVAELREENVKHFRNADGSFTAVQYDLPVHTLDEEGKWQDIDNTLKGVGSEYTNPNARIKFAKKITGNETLFTLHEKNRKLTMSLDGARKKTTGKAINTETQFDESATLLQKLMTLDKLTSRVIYEDILDGVDLEYVAESCNIKENLIVKKHLSSYSFTFTMKLNNLAAALLADGSIAVTDGDELVYAIPAPIVFDAAENYAPESTASYALTHDGNNRYQLTVTVDKAWMESADRAYPVTVDPPIYTNSSTSILDLDISSQNPENNSSSDAHIWVDSTYRSYWRMTTLPTLTAGSYVTEASLTMGYWASVSTTGYIGAYAVTSSWNSTLNWNRFTASSPQGKIDTRCYDYAKISFTSNFSTSNHKTFSLDVTALVKGWYERKIPNYGLCLMAIPGTTFTGCARIFSNNYATVGLRPSMVIQYRKSGGVEDYWPTISQNAGYAGAGSVNLSQGYLTFAFNGWSTTDGIMPYTPALVYNSTLANKYFSSSAVNTTYTVSIAGYGWKLASQQSVQACSYTDQNGSSQIYYIWVDSDGTEHAFMRYQSSGSMQVYFDEDGLGLRLTVHTSSTDLRYAISSQYGDILYFNANGWLTRQVDTFGNYRRYQRDTYGKLTNVYLKTVDRSTEIEQIHYTYNASSLLSAITYVGSGRQIRFLYASKPFGTTASQNSVGYLTEIEFHSSSASTTPLAAVKYTYTSNGELNSVTDVTTGRMLSYLWSGGELYNVTEWITLENGDKKSGQQLKPEFFVDGKNETVIRTSGPDDVLYTADDLLTHYVLDSYGRLISNYVTNVDGSKIYGTVKTSYEETTEETFRKANRISEQVSAGATPVNYLVNGTFTNSTSGWSFSGTTGSLVKSDNGNAVKIKYSGTNTSPKGMYQNVFLQPGTYTFSADLKLPGTSKNASARLRIATNSGTQLAASDWVSNGTVIGHTAGYVPLTVSFTAGTAALYRFYIELDTTSTAAELYADNVSLVKADSVGSLSLVNDGCFEKISGSGFTHWTTNQSGTLYTSSQIFEGRYALTLSGKPNVRASVSQTVKLLSDSEKSSIISDKKKYEGGIQTFVLSGYIKGSSVALKDDRKFGLEAVVSYLSSTGSTVYGDPVTIAGDPHSIDWQYLNGTITTDPELGHPYEIRISCCYDYNTGSAYFDNVVLVQASEAVSYEYNNEGNITKSVNGGRSTAYDYAPNGVDVVRERYSDGTTITRHYNGNHQVTSETYHEGTSIGTDTLKLSARSYIYNSLGLLESSLTVADDLTQLYTKYEYSTDTATYGKTKAITTTSGTTRYFYSTSASDYGYLKAVLGENGQGTAYTYDSMGRQSTAKPAYLNSSKTGYITETNTESAAFAYSKNQLTSVTTQTAAYDFTYDVYGNRESTGVGGSKLARYLYNTNNGKPRYMLYANGYVLRYDYDALERLESVWAYEQGNVNATEAQIQGYSYSKVSQYVYDSEGNVSEFIDYRTGERYIYRYDINGRQESVCRYTLNGSTILLHDKISCTYDANARLSGVKGVHLINGNSFTYTQTYVYDGLGRVTAYNGNGITTGYEYDSMGNLNRMVSTMGSVSLSHGYTYEKKQVRDEVTGEWEWRLTGRISGDQSKVTVGSTEKISNYTYTYNEAGFISEISLDGMLKYKYTYDNLGQLIREDNAVSMKSYVYEYDNGGNITAKKTYAFRLGTLEEVQSTYTYSYGNSSWKDQLTSYRGTAITYDSLGNPLSYYNGSSYSFTWEKGRKLSRVQKGSSSFEFTYDESGHRIQKTSYADPIQYVWSGDRLIAEYREGYDTTIYLYDASGSPVGFMYKDFPGYYTGGEFLTFYYEKNLQGDIVGILDSDGNKFVSYSYDAWGNLLKMEYTGSNLWSLHYNMAEQNPFRYRGYYYDRETGFYYLNSRYYDPATGRFLNADGYVSTGTGVLGYNMYAYCNNNPINMLDTIGSIPFFAITAAIGAVAGAVVGGIIAAQNGGNVWAGIGIGAAAGALIGTGVGMAAGAALAGSITATTGAVMAGGSTLVATVSTGGLGAGAAFIANNLSQAINNLAPTAQAAVDKMKDVATKGKTGEALSGLIKNTTHIPSLTGTASYRIPDGLDVGMKILSEVKNYAGTLSYTNQLKDFVMWSQANGYQMHLYTNAMLSGPLQQLVDSGIILLFPLG